MKYHNIAKDNFLNGDGLRAVLFVSGCTHACPECHNPVTWNKNGGLNFDEAAKKELFDYLKNDYVSGITFSGGDPLAGFNREEVLALMKEVKEKFPNKTIWVYTGFTKSELEDQGFWDRLKPNIDVIVEGKYVHELRSTSYHWAGSLNQRVLRKESNFMINTSDPIYENLNEMTKDIDRIGASYYLKEALKILEIELNPNPCNENGLLKLEDSVNKILEISKKEKQENAPTYLIDQINNACNKILNEVKERLNELDKEYSVER